MDDIILDLNFRFSGETITVFNLSILLPNNLLKSDDETNNECVSSLWKTYDKILSSNVTFNSESVFKSEIMLWKLKLLRVIIIDKKEKNECKISVMEVSIQTM